ncbi:HAD-IIIA family hydrolase [Lysinibacillus agricola]|uniref:HAD-IIIA family hydrolase n=1 Tax=Lysinibacillus agricola TaxID=2590012 RepID=A0ABX7AMP0_9BACI|nr:MULTISPECIES: HAD-IIIA family hydrolase [Lysinibacillus]QQP10445.1 HAD-IIIA family hydrolase [Lysinibacillus agricola]
MIIFDLDDTLVDTSKIKQFRRVNWKKCCELIPTETKLNINLEVIKKLKSKYSIAIVTNSPQFYAEMVLQNHGLDVDVLISYRDTVKHKPHPEPMLLAAKKMNAVPDKCIAIGDNVNDIISSNKAGMKSVAVTWGEHNQNDFKAVDYYALYSEKKLLEDYLLSLV